MTPDNRLVSERFPRSSRYHSEWALSNACGGANFFWITECWPETRKKGMPLKGLFILLILLSFSAVINAQAPAERSEDRLKGPIKTVRGEYRQLLYRNDRWVEGERLLSYIESYAPNGVIIKTTKYKPDGSIDYELTPPADPNERVGYITCSTCNGKTEFRTTPDSKGRVSKELTKQ